MIGIKQYIGSAMKRPIELEKGSARIVYDFEVIKQSILDILMTPIGTRFFNREYGSRIDECKFEQNDDILTNILRYFIKIAITKWESRVRFDDTIFEINEDRVDCIISVIVVATNRVETFVFPFYKSLKY